MRRKAEFETERKRLKKMEVLREEEYFGEQKE